MRHSCQDAGPAGGGGDDDGASSLALPKIPWYMQHNHQKVRLLGMRDSPGALDGVSGGGGTVGKCT